MENQTIQSLEEEQELLEISKQNAKGYQEKQDIQKQIDAIERQKKASAEKMKKYVEQTQAYAEKIQEENPSAITQEEKNALVAMEEKSEQIIQEQPERKEASEKASKANSDVALSTAEKNDVKKQAQEKVEQIQWQGIDSQTKAAFGESMEEVAELRAQAKKTNDKQEREDLEEKASEKETEAYGKVIAAKEEALIELLRKAEVGIDQMDPASAKKLQNKLSKLSDDYEKLSKDNSDDKKLAKLETILADLKQIQEEIPSSEEEVIVLNEEKNETSEVKAENNTTKAKEDKQDFNQENQLAASNNSNRSDNPSEPNQEEVARNEMHDKLEIERNDEVSYGIAPEVVKAQQAAEEKEKEVVALLDEAKAYRQMAEEDPKKANKYNRKAEKLEDKAMEERAEIQEKYGELNDNEISTNFNEITYSLDNLFIDSTKVDTVKQIVKAAETLQKEAKRIREKAKETKDPIQKNDLYNEAYEKEVAAIKKQNAILSGQFDAEEEESDVSFVVNTGPKKENKYTEQAEEFRVKARNEEDEGKRLEYLELARKYELASDEGRNQRIEDEAKERKGAFEQRAPFVELAREQSKQNKFANDAYTLELEADSIFNEGQALLNRAKAEENTVERIELTQRATDVIMIAKERQNDAIQKYQESKANPDDENVALAFTKASDKKKEAAKEELPETIAETAAPEEVAVAPEVSNETQEQEEASNETVENSQSQEVEVVNNVPDQQEEQGEEVNAQPIVENDPIVNENKDQIVNELPIANENESAEVAVQEKRDRAKEIEDAEASRVDKIYELKQKASEAQEKSENALKKVDGLKDPAEIQQQLALAEKYRQEAEKYEVQAKTEEEYLNNNMAEARSLKQEAEMIEAAQSPKEAEVTTPEVVAEPEPEEETIAVNTPVEEVAPIEEPTEEPTNELGPEDQFTRPDISWGNIRLLGEKSTEAETVNEELSLGGNKTYSSSDEIPMDPELPNGVIYKVQIGAFRKKIDPSIFNGISPIVGESTNQGFTRYTAGTFRGFKSANMAKGRIRNLGFRDAFVVAFYNGERITLDEAEEAIEKANDSEKFVYENIVQDEVDQLKAAGIKEEEAFATGNSDLSRSPVVNTGASNTASVASSTPAGNLNQRTDVYFTVQVGAFSSPKTSAELYGIQPLYSFTTPSGIIRYSTGVYKTFSEADAKKQQVRSSTGPADAFVTAYNGQDKISVDEAKQQLGDGGSSSEETSVSENTRQNTGEISFAVQIGAYRTEINPASAPILQNLTQYGIEFQQSSNGYYVYFAGDFNNKLDADNLKTIIRDAGISDAFVVAFQDGKKISVRKALEILDQ